MRESLIEGLKELAKREYQQEIRAIKERYRAKIEALEWVAESAKKEDPEFDVIIEVETIVSRNVIDACSKLTPPFKREDVANKLNELYGNKAPSRAILAKTLSELVSDGKLAIVFKGRGRLPSEYRIAPT